MIKSGWLTSEFWLNVLAGAVCGGAYALHHPLDNAAVFSMFTIVELYTYHRIRLKQSAVQAWTDVNKQINLSSVIVPILNSIENAMKVNGVEKDIINKIISIEITKLTSK